MRPTWALRVAIGLALAASLAGCAAGSGHRANSATVAQHSGKPLVAVPVSTSTRWRVIYRTSEKQVLLTGLSVIGQRDAWVVGTAGYLHPKPLVLHWNGTNWRPVTLPAAPGFQPGGVQSTAANDVWIFGQERGGPAEAIRYDGTSWRFQPLPAGNWLDASTFVLSPADAWLVTGGCALNQTPSGCSSTLAHWNGRAWTSARLGVLISGLAEVGGRVWLVGVAGIRSDSEAGGRTAGTGRVVVYRRAGPGWVRSSAPTVTVSSTSCVGNPQLAAGPDGSAWILCLTQGGRSRQGALYYWGGQHWSDIAIPARTGKSAMSAVDQLSFDDHDGVRLGPFAHWTGQSWVKVSSVDPGRKGTVFLGQAAGIPGAPGAWAIGGSGAFIVTVPSGPGVIAVNGPVPG